MQNKTTFQVDNLVFRRTIGFNTIQNRITTIARDINEDYKHKNPVFVITMKGAIFFAMELLKCITVSHTVDTVSAKSYQGEMKSNGNVALQFHTTDWQNKDIIIIEDIVDTGHTISRLVEEIQKQQPTSITVATLIKKPQSASLNANIKYWGFEMEQTNFIIGFGLDYKEYGRNLNGLYILENPPQ